MLLSSMAWLLWPITNQTSHSDLYTTLWVRVCSLVALVSRYLTMIQWGRLRGAAHIRYMQHLVLQYRENSEDLNARPRRPRRPRFRSFASRHLRPGGVGAGGAPRVRPARDLLSTRGRGRPGGNKNVTRQTKSIRHSPHGDKALSGAFIFVQRIVPASGPDTLCVENSRSTVFQKRSSSRARYAHDAALPLQCAAVAGCMRSVPHR